MDINLISHFHFTSDQIKLFPLKRMLNCICLFFVVSFTTVLSSPSIEDEIYAINSDNSLPINQLNFSALGIEDGLSDNLVHQMLQDDLGFIWLSTGHGLSRYDGQSFKNYNNNLNEPESISNNNVQSIFQDNKGSIWVGTLNGLNRLNAQQTGFVHYFDKIGSENLSNNSLSNSSITAINQDSSGKLWFGTGNGINLLVNSDTNSFKQYLVSTSTPLIINFIQPHNKTILVGTSGGLFSYNSKADEFVIVELSVKKIKANANFLTAFIDNKQTLWLSIKDEGVMFQKQSSGTFERLDVANTINNFNSEDDAVTAINEDINGLLWMGTINNGLFTYSSEDGSLKVVQRITNSKRYPIKSLSINSILKDQSGLMWIGSNMSGVLQWSPHTLHIRHLDKYNFNNDDFLTNSALNSSIIWHFVEDDNGLIWIATGNGIYTYEPYSGEINLVNLKKTTAQNEPEVFYITVENNLFWFTTETSIIQYSPVNGILQRIEIEPKSDFSLPADAYLYSAEYLDGILYVALAEHNLLAFDIKKRKVKEIELKGNTAGSAASKRPMALKKALDNSLWILSKDGLFNYSPLEKRIRLAIKGGATELSNDRIAAIYEESPNSIWLGTSGNGINHLIIHDYKNGSYRIKQYNHIPELKNRIINGVMLDNSNPARLWISSHGGLFNFNTKTHKVREYSVKDGLQGREFNEGAYLKDSMGYMYFGGTNGFNRLTPSEFGSSLYEPPLRFTNISIQCPENIFPCNGSFTANDFNQSCKVNDSCLEGQIERFHIPSDIEKIELSFAALDFTSPNSNQYRYRLYSDQKTPWVDLKNESTLLFPSLESNRYTLELQGSNYAGTWGESVTRFNFIIDAPWYRQESSYFIYLCLMLLTLYLFFTNWKIKQEEEKKVSLAIAKSEENFKFALWGSGDELWEWYPDDGKLIRTNPIKLIDDFDFQKSGQITDILKLIYHEDRENIYKNVVSHLKGDSPYFESFLRIKSKGGGYISTLARARVVERNKQGRATRLLGSTKDISVIKATEDKLKLMAKAFENTMDGISILDPSFNSVLNNQAFYKITGLSLSAAINTQYFFSEDSLNHEQYQQIKITLKNFGEWEGEIWERRADGEKFALNLKIDSVLDNHRQVSHYICVFSDVTYRKKAEEELRKLANIDSLTSLPNRALFMDRLSQAMAFAKRNNSKFALMFLDLDHFKNINDSLGHSVGDELLRKVAKRLSRCVRDADTVARLGGDEFTIILENIRNADEAGKCADKIINRMSKSIDVAGTILKTSPSIGIGIYPNDGDNIESLLKNADLAMYSAKEKGRNNYQFFTADMTSSAIERINIENKLRIALEKNELELYYQPKVCAVSGKLTGFEALIRWIHPEEGIISPADFIPVAEETGLILPMGDWILEDAIKTAKSWSEINPECSSIAINLSARQFQQGELADNITGLLGKYDLKPKFIELEITEGTLMSNMDHAISTLKRLNDMGISLSLDDFGTGYSSLSYLKRFPVNKLKVDQSFVRDITTDEGNASIVGTIISLSHNLGLTVIAEGCETVEQLSFINSYGCEEVQGYLFSRPLPKADAELILRQGEIIIDRSIDKQKS